MSPKVDPQGFILSEAALYAFKCQDVFPDIVSFAAAIPGNLRQLFLIPIAFESVTASGNEIAARVADDMQPSGCTPEGDLFSYQTFVNDDVEGTIPNSLPGSIFEVNDADSITHTDDGLDENIQVPTDTSYMSDVDMTGVWDYPYRTKEKPVRKSSVNVTTAAILHVALRPRQIKKHRGISRNAEKCSVELASPPTHTQPDDENENSVMLFTFTVVSAPGKNLMLENNPRPRKVFRNTPHVHRVSPYKTKSEPHTVKVSVVDLDHVAMSCDCNFWRYNGPEHKAQSNDYMFGDPNGTAAAPNERDPSGKFWLCKHTYAVLTRLDGFISQLMKENPKAGEDEILDVLDTEWDRLGPAVEIPLDDFNPDEIQVDWDIPEGMEPVGPEELGPTDEPEELGPISEPGLEVVDEPEELGPTSEPKLSPEPEPESDELDITFDPDLGIEFMKDEPDFGFMKGEDPYDLIDENPETTSLIDEAKDFDQDDIWEEAGDSDRGGIGEMPVPKPEVSRPNRPKPGIIKFDDVVEKNPTPKSKKPKSKKPAPPPPKVDVPGMPESRKAPVKKVDPTGFKPTPLKKEKIDMGKLDVKPPPRKKAEQD